MFLRIEYNKKHSLGEIVLFLLLIDLNVNGEYSIVNEQKYPFNFLLIDLYQNGKLVFYCKLTEQ